MMECRICRVRPTSRSIALSCSDQPIRERQVALAACGRREDGDYAALLAALGQLWAAGYPIDWSDVLPKVRTHRFRCPTIHGNASVIGLPPRKYARRLRTREPSALQSIKNS